MESAQVVVCERAHHAQDQERLGFAYVKTPENLAGFPLI